MTSEEKQHYCFKVALAFVDTDGDCWNLIPLFLEGGATGMYPFETACGMDIIKVRKHFPDLKMMGKNSFMNIMTSPSAIQKALAAAAGGTSN